MGIYKGQDKILNSITAVEEEKVKEIVGNELKGTEITQTVIDTYGTEILKYPVGRWYIITIDIASNFTDLPVQQAGIIEIATIDKVSTSNPWDNTYSSRIITYTTYNDATYVYKLYSGGTAGVMMTDTGWKRVCTTSVDDVATTIITFSDETKYKNASNTLNYFSIKNGICHASLYFRCLAPSSSTLYVTTNLPTPKNNVRVFMLEWNIANASTNNILVSLNMNSTSMGLSGGTATKSYLVQFSYPVAE